MILLSIHPEFVARIRSGEKRFEFRTRAPGSLETDPLVAVYATAPTGAIVGYFRVANVLSLPPSALWERTKDAAGISRARFRAYFKGRDTAHALEIAEWRGWRSFAGRRSRRSRSSFSPRNSVGGFCAAQRKAKANE